MRKLLGSIIVALSLSACFSAEAAAAGLEAWVSISKQIMVVKSGDRVLYQWPVSTARKGYVTPRGRWKPTRMHRMWRSRKYDMSPMPFSIFYHKGYAVHGTYAVKSLGRPASHGCVRLHPDNAARLYSLVQKVGPANTVIVVTD